MGGGQLDRENEIKDSYRTVMLSSCTAIMKYFYFWWKSHQGTAQLLPFVFHKSSFIEPVLRSQDVWPFSGISSVAQVVSQMRHKSTSGTFNWWHKSLNLSICLCDFVCYSLAWIHIKYEQVKMKYSASYWKKITYFQAMCPCELCREAAGKWCLSASEDLTFSPVGFQGQDYIFIANKTALSYRG